MTHLFISHSSHDDDFVRRLRQVLADVDVPAWIDSRQLLPGGLLDPDVARAIDEASAFAVVVSRDAFESRWVGKELRRALEVQKARGRDAYPVVVLALDGAKPGMVESFFDGEPLYIATSSGAGGVEAALGPILTALGRRLPADVPAAPQPRAEPLEELVLALTDLRFREVNGVRRASALAQLVHEPATSGQEPVHSARSWLLFAPTGPIEAEELRWYLEKYAVWPSKYFHERARHVEAKLVEWGQQLHTAAMPVEHTANVMQSWARIDAHAGRRFSVHLNTTPVAGAPDAEEKEAREAATLLLGLPWELLHDGTRFLFQGATPTRVRRRLPGKRAMPVPVVATPIRILLITARPEDEACRYIDHRASALPLVSAMEALGGLVEIHLLGTPTLPALREELDRARRERTPYHVVHFDGHGVYDRRVGLGALCFEDPRDKDKPERRRHVTVDTNEIGPLLSEHRIPVVFLEACQTAQADKASESVASELLRVGVASVVAMSHSVLVETARRFVEAFYRALARGARVGDAMLDGQRALEADDFRGTAFGVGELRLDDWFVPVLFQEKADPQLFTTIPAPQTMADARRVRDARLGEVPDAPETTFVGRSRDLLALEGLLRTERHAVVRGQGGEGKTALASELARWMVRSQQIERAAFVSVETHGDARAVLDAIGRQLVGKGYSVATFADLDAAVLPVERALVEQSTLLVVDNMESVLLPPYVETPEALSEDARESLGAILALCARLNAVGETRVAFTSREALPAPFDGVRHRRELHRLDREDAVKLVERVLDRESAGTADDAAREAIEALVDAVHGHARTLALLAPSLRDVGVDATRTSLVELMAEMERRFPGDREQSLFASVELSLRRMSLENRERVRVLGVFHGAVDLDVLRDMMHWTDDDVASLGGELTATGLAKPDPYNHLTLDPALCPYLRGRMNAAEHAELAGRWREMMGAYVLLLLGEQGGDITLAATLTVLELPNLFALLDIVFQAGDDAAATAEMAARLYTLLAPLGRSQLLARVAEMRDKAAARLTATWSHSLFAALSSRIDQQTAAGRLREALDGARDLLRHADAAGARAYDGAEYHLAMIRLRLARVLGLAGSPDQGLPLLMDAQDRFEDMTKTGNAAAARMASVCLTERGDCLQALGRLDEAAACYEERILRGESAGQDRGVAIAKLQLGTIRVPQRRYDDALKAFEDARDLFARLDEPRSVASVWYQIGRVYQAMSQPDAAEDAYQKSLSIAVRIGDVAGQASTLGQLGNLYGDILGRPQEASAFQRQAADRFVELEDTANEGLARSNLAETLRRLGRLDEARREIERAIACVAQFGHASHPWGSWAVLTEIETAAGDRTAAGDARRHAIESFLAYRRDGGENHDGPSRLTRDVTEALRAGDRASVDAGLRRLIAAPESSRLRPYIEALRSVVGGSRDRTLADAPELSYRMSAEILLLIETLEAGKR